MKIIVPMAGLGTRFARVAFQNSEYKKPKPLINVRGHPMICWALSSLPFLERPGQIVSSHLHVSLENLIFVILRQHDEEFAIEKLLREIYSNKIAVIKLDAITRGSAETAYMAAHLLEPEEDVLFSDSDHYFNGTVLQNTIINKKTHIAGIIPVFRAPKDGIARWSYSLVKSGTDIIERVAEKNPELMEKGAYANIGAYYFSKAKYFLEEIEQSVANNERFGEKNKEEFYVAPLYQKLLDRGYELQAAMLPEAWSLGTPSDLNHFLKNCKIQEPL